MSEERKNLSDQELKTIVGGLMDFNPRTMIMTYTHDDGSVTMHPILDYDKAWMMSNDLHARSCREDMILEMLQSAGYIG